jgi:hypothetical protein
VEIPEIAKAGGTFSSSFTIIQKMLTELAISVVEVWAFLRASVTMGIAAASKTQKKYIY